MVLSKFMRCGPNWGRFYSQKYHYDIPERYRNAFYLANAAFFDSVNWFVHRAYEVSFDSMVKRLQEEDPTLHTKKAMNEIDDFIRLLEQCNSIIDVRYPIRRNNGRNEIVRGFRAHHGLLAGADYSLGGLRLCQNITRDHMKALATLSTYKYACLGIPLAGAHGGIKVNPYNYKDNELKLVVEKYAQELRKKGYCNDRDIFQTDLNTSERQIKWLSSCSEENCAGNSRTFDATRGTYFALEYFLNNEKVLEHLQLKKGIKDKTYIIQGLGKLGSTLAKILQHNGAICVGVQEHDAHLYDPDGIDVQALCQCMDHNRSIVRFPQTKPFTSDVIYTKDCDILILAAQQKTLICHTAPNVKAKVILEAADGAITPTSHRIFTYSKLVLPDIYVSAGYTVTSFIEHLLKLNETGFNFENSNVGGIYKNVVDFLVKGENRRQVVAWNNAAQKDIDTDLEQDVITYIVEHVLTETANDIMDIADEYDLGLDLRTAAYIKAINNMFRAMRELKENPTKFKN